MDYSLTPEEIEAIQKYQENDFRIINSLLRKGMESERRINLSRKGGYPPITKEKMEESLRDIQYLYSAILKRYVANGCVKAPKPLYRGTQTSLISSLQNENSSFLSTSSSILQTRTFSKIFSRESKGADESERAVLLIEGNVPWMSVEDEIGGGEDEFLFVPSRVEIEETDLSFKKKFGQEYIMKLSEIDIPEKSMEEIEQLRQEILEQTERMSSYLEYLLVTIENPNIKDDSRVLSIIQAYDAWKDLVIQYNYQQFRILKNKFLEGAPLVEEGTKVK